MKLLLATALSIFLMSECAFSNTYKLDAAKTSAAPWKAGDIVFKYKLNDDDIPPKLHQQMRDKEIEIKFLGVTLLDTSIYYVIQNFYADTKKPFTNAYLTRDKRSVTQRLKKQDSLYGNFIIFAPNGQKLTEGKLQNGYNIGIQREWSLIGYLTLEEHSDFSFHCEWNDYGYLEKQVGNCPSLKPEEPWKVGKAVYKYPLNNEVAISCCFPVKDRVGVGIERIYLGTHKNADGTVSYRLQDFYINTKQPFSTEYLIKDKKYAHKGSIDSHSESNQFVVWHPNGQKAAEGNTDNEGKVISVSFWDINGKLLDENDVISEIQANFLQ